MCKFLAESDFVNLPLLRQTGCGVMYYVVCRIISRSQSQKIASDSTIETDTYFANTVAVYWLW